MSDLLDSMPETINIREVHDHASAVRYLEARYKQLAISLGNLLEMADRALDRGDAQSAREFLAEAQPFIDERKRIEACWKRSDHV